VAVCCIMLQCVAVCCSVLPGSGSSSGSCKCVVVCCSALQHHLPLTIYLGCSVLKCVTVCSSRFQCRIVHCVAIYCNVLQCIVLYYSVILHCMTVHYSILHLVMLLVAARVVPISLCFTLCTRVCLSPSLFLYLSLS